MIKNDILEINELNKNFYSAHSESFDRSREFYWQGFQNTLNYIKSQDKVLDLGCGNGRFYKFLIENQKNINYLGVDANEKFILKNKEIYPEARFQVLDIINDLNQINNKFTMITIFGVTHHIPSKEYRKEWFEKVKNLAEDGGLIIISFWNFDISKEDKKFVPRYYQKEVGDYFLGWKGDFKEHRYCHLFSNEEIKEIKEIFSDFQILEDFSKEDNRYLIFQKK